MAIALPERTYSDLSGMADGKYILYNAIGAFAANLMTYDIAKRKAERCSCLFHSTLSAPRKKKYMGGNSYAL